MKFHPKDMGSKASQCFFIEHFIKDRFVSADQPLQLAVHEPKVI